MNTKKVFDFAEYDMTYLQCSIEIKFDFYPYGMQR